MIDKLLQSLVIILGIAIGMYLYPFIAKAINVTASVPENQCNKCLNVCHIK